MTGAGMMDCKKALEETNGNMDDAVKMLREKGMAQAAKRADRAAHQGVIATASLEDGRTASLIDLRSETDFVARNDEFLGLAARIAEHVARSLDDNPSLDDALASKLGGTETVGEAVTALSGKIGEKIELAGVARFTAPPSGIVDVYIHHDGTKGAMVQMDSENGAIAAGEEFRKLAHELALQVVVTSPTVVRRENIAQSDIDRELEVERHRAINEGKPEAAADKIAEGRVQKNFIAAHALYEQGYWRDEKQTVGMFLKEASNRVGTPVKVIRFMRMSTSEGA